MTSTQESESVKKTDITFVTPDNIGSKTPAVTVGIPINRPASLSITRTQYKLTSSYNSKTELNTNYIDKNQARNFGISNLPIIGKAIVKLVKFAF